MDGGVIMKEGITTSSWLEDDLKLITVLREGQLQGCEFLVSGEVIDYHDIFNILCNKYELDCQADRSLPDALRYFENELYYLSKKIIDANMTLLKYHGCEEKYKDNIVVTKLF